jgi:hypothetical protein
MIGNCNQDASAGSINNGERPYYSKSVLEMNRLPKRHVMRIRKIEWFSQRK